MKLSFPHLVALALGLVAPRGVVVGAVITVDTIDNLNPPAGKTSLKQALANLRDGDQVRFRLPGTGPFFLLTPPDGYAPITVSNVTIDGYSQPGAQPNTNPILAPNNAKLMVVLDSRNGHFTSLNLWPDNAHAGYGETDYAILGVVRARNVTLQGLCLLGMPPSFANASGSQNRDYGIAFAGDDTGAPLGGHVSGCWIGVAPDGKTLSGTTEAITGFRWLDQSGANPVPISNLTIGVGQRSTNAPAEFNVLVQAAIPIQVEGDGTRISGNFIGVLPDGVTEHNVALETDGSGSLVWTGDFQYQGAIEIGRGGNNTLIGTDGDGVNDANERNVIAGTLPKRMNGYDHTIEFYGNSPGTNIIIAGNYLGVGIDGTTYFTNGVPAINAAGANAHYRIGSNLDGVSDATEGNLIVNSWPASVFPASELVDSMTLNFFDDIAVGSVISARGNSFINNYSFPVSATQLNGTDNFLESYYTGVLLDVTQGVVPRLATNTSSSRLVGTVPLADTNHWPTTMIDLYAADPEGLAYGRASGLAELTNGFVQGRLFVGSFTDNGANDLDQRPGYFDFDLSKFNTRGSVITVAASYLNLNSNLVMTSPFADPASVTYVPSLSLGIVLIEGGLKITTDPQPMPAGFVIQYGATVSGPWVTQAGLNTPVTIPIGAEARRFVRVAKP